MESCGEGLPGGTLEIWVCFLKGKSSHHMGATLEKKGRVAEPFEIVFSRALCSVALRIRTATEDMMMPKNGLKHHG